ncbi:hypothetical protein WBG78_24875 [Chryseolinea sp. T2]|uniref:hypothetical protein n=1 Tax=Chryseolinea sp. T2 TaxID=3129255 RepID=UPI0030780DB0
MKKERFFKIYRSLLCLIDLSFDQKLAVAVVGMDLPNNEQLHASYIANRLGWSRKKALEVIYSLPRHIRSEDSECEYVEETVYRLTELGVRIYGNDNGGYVEVPEGIAGAKFIFGTRVTSFYKLLISDIQNHHRDGMEYRKKSNTISREFGIDPGKKGRSCVVANALASIEKGGWIGREVKNVPNSNKKRRRIWITSRTKDLVTFGEDAVSDIYSHCVNVLPNQGEVERVEYRREFWRKANEPRVSDGEIHAQFDRLLAAYGDRGNKTVARKFWNGLKQEERDEIESAVVPYLEATNKGSYRENLEAWINPHDKLWKRFYKNQTPAEQSDFLRDAA